MSSCVGWVTASLFQRRCEVEANSQSNEGYLKSISQRRRLLLPMAMVMLMVSFLAWRLLWGMILRKSPRSQSLLMDPNLLFWKHRHSTEFIAPKTSIVTQCNRDIPAHLLPFVRVCRANFVAVAPGVGVQLGLNETTHEVTAHGDCEAVGHVMRTIKDTIEVLNGIL